MMAVERSESAMAHEVSDAAPVHVAVIMDGNGRWARRRGLGREEGHEAGTENIRQIIEAFADRGVRYLTLYAFSTENWGRPKEEIDGLMRILGEVIEREVEQLHRNGIRVIHIGRLDALPGDLQGRVRDAIALTSENDGMTMAIAFNYGGRREIVDAVRRIVEDGVPAADIDEALVSSYLYTAGIPDPDLVIRTAGEMRLSNFLLWQTAYAEFYTTPTLWPDFGSRDIDCALAEYRERMRRFGGLHPSEIDDGTRTPSSDCTPSAP